MKVYHDINTFNRLRFAVVTSGTFDGVHRGHQKILNRLKEIAIRDQGETVLITYWPHPRLVLNPSDQSVKLLNTFAEKSFLLEQAGVEHLVCIPFTRSFSELSASEFIREILVNKIGTKKLVIGYDHHYGKNREGHFEQLRNDGPGFGFEVEEIPRQDIDESAISSSSIRKFLKEGSVKKAAQLLGRHYSLQGRVVTGEQLGRQLGFPTANISLERSGDRDNLLKLIPGEGIYAVRIKIGDEVFDGMLYIGQRPTVGGEHQSIEVNIFDFNRNIYNEIIEVSFIEMIRGDIKFNNLDELREQLFLDQQHTIHILKQYNSRII